MFGRKRPETEDRNMADEADDLGIPMKPVRQPGQTAIAAVNKAPAPVPPRAAPAELPRPASEPARVADAPPRRMPEPLPTARRNEADLRKLIVGREISLSGEINSCDRLIVEGSVEANLQNCREVEIAETGHFKGSASVDEVEVRGRFEGNLTVRNRLMIYATGRVSGTIRYGQIEIECGGQVSGEVQSQSSNGDLIAELSGARAAH
jgi:cytoskeletal protein CcmA (bactofilin family)